MIDAVLTCPLGSKCEEIKDNKLHRCVWFIELKGKNPQTGEDLDERACAIAWLPILQIEVANVNRGVHSALISIREETVVRQDLALSRLTNGTN